MDDTFLLFKSENEVKKFLKYIGSRHKNISFTFEIEQGNSLSFLDVLVSREGTKFSTSLYRKSTFSGLYSNFSSFLPVEYKKGLIFTLLYRGFTLCTDFDKFQNELLFLKRVLNRNQYPRSFVDECIRKFFDKRSSPKPSVATVEKKEIRICLPFLGKESLKIKANLLKFAKTYLPGDCKLNVIFKVSNRLGDCFRFKDVIPRECRSLILYKFQCGKCNLAYYGKTFRLFRVRVFEHTGTSLRTWKQFTYNPSNSNNTSVLNHLAKCKANATIDNFEIIGSADNDFNLRIKESLLIKKDDPVLNKSVKSTPLLLF